MADSTSLQHLSTELEAFPAHPTSLEMAITEAETRVEIINKVTAISLKRLAPQDIVDFGGKPYICASGAERIRPLFGITVTNLDLKRYTERDTNGEYFWIAVSALAHFRGDEIAIIGTCSSRDKFFAMRKGELVPSSEVDPTNIAKAALSNLYVNAVTRILGLRNLTWEQLEALGFDRSKSAKVVFKESAGTKSQSPQPNKESAAKGQPAPGGPPDGRSWFTSLQAAVAARVGGNAGSPDGLALLAKLTAYKQFPGWRSWTTLQGRDNCEQVCQIAYDKLQKLPPAAPTEAPDPTPLPPPEEPPQEGLGL